MSVDDHTLEIGPLCERLGCDPRRGLSGADASERLLRFGPNALVEKARKSAFHILLDQLRELMVLVLIAAAAISLLLYEFLDAVVIGLIVLLNTVLGFWQEFKAEKSMAALKKMAVPSVRVLRGGREREIPSQALVPGDVLLIREGDAVAADGRLIDGANLMLEESALTGESEPVEKDARFLAGADTPLAERKNMIYRGTRVTYGRGTALVTQTGMNTELGKIASMLQDVEEEKTPLQKRLARLSIQLSVLALGLIVLVAGLNHFRGSEWKDTILTALSMAVAAIPEGLPAVVTIALALGARRMFRQKSLIRRLPAVETLGSVTVICSDKTGTLTQNRMSVTELCLPDGKACRQRALAEAMVSPPLQRLLVCGALCNDASMAESENGEPGRILGDPTEGALLAAAQKAGLDKAELERLLPRVAEWPFDSQRKRMTTLHRLSDDADPCFQPIAGSAGAKAPPWVAFTKGAVDGLIERCSGRIHNEHTAPLTRDVKSHILAQNQRLAENGIRVLALACRPVAPQEKDAKESWETGMVFLGLAALADPVRPEAVEAVRSCRSAGIRVIMITGDHPLTAAAVARELGIAVTGGTLTGSDLDGMDPAQIGRQLDAVSVFARVSPEHKMMLIDALQQTRHIVAMTGDGVNDAPALKSADIGVAMGITGTDVSKDSADMVLLDDNFATIVTAVREGRVIFDNIRKFVKYILTGNAGEIFVMLAGSLLGMPVPLLPLQILWINLVTDGAPAVALGYEEAEEEVMNRPPYSPAEGVFSRGNGLEILLMGIVIGAISAAAGFLAWTANPESRAWQTMIFTTVTFCQMVYALCVRKTRRSFFTRPARGNPLMVPAVSLTLIAQLALIYHPFLNRVFKTVPLNLPELSICLGASALVLAVSECHKMVARAKAAAPDLKAP